MWPAGIRAAGVWSAETAFSEEGLFHAARSEGDAVEMTHFEARNSEACRNRFANRTNARVFSLSHVGYPTGGSPEAESGCAEHLER